MWKELMQELLCDFKAQYTVALMTLQCREKDMLESLVG